MAEKAEARVRELEQDKSNLMVEWRVELAMAHVAGKRDEFEAEIEVLCADDTNNNRRGMLMKAVSLEKHAQIAVNLSNATKVWVGLERQAFGIKEEVSGTGAHEAGLDDLA